MSNKNYDYLFKILLIGDPAIGKSSILLRFSDDIFTQSYITTIGIDFRIRLINHNGTKIKLQLWDTAGQERFRSVATAYYRGASGIMVIYDVTDPQSFKNVDQWFKEIDIHAPDTIKMLVGTKADLVESRKIEYKAGLDIANAHSVKFFETSAKSGFNIDKVFSAMVDLILAKTNGVELPYQVQLEPADIIPQKNNSNKKCCD